MIAVDTSALMAVALREPGFEICVAALASETEVLISAGTLAEALIVAGRRRVGDEILTLVETLGFTVVPVTADAAHRVGRAYAAWGEGVHPAGLNFGDCFAYALAVEYACPLLFVGEDFAKTDVAVATR